MGLDRGLADEEALGGVAVGAACGDELEDFELALTEQLRCRRFRTRFISTLATDGASTD
jgi:hypothetical protein